MLRWRGRRELPGGSRGEWRSDATAWIQVHGHIVWIHRATLVNLVVLRVVRCFDRDGAIDVFFFLVCSVCIHVVIHFLHFIEFLLLGCSCCSLRLLLLESLFLRQ